MSEWLTTSSSDSQRPGTCVSQQANRGLTVWLTGLSSAGKTTLARALCVDLTRSGFRVELLDGDEVRHNLCYDLGFSKEDRDENVRRIAYVAALLTRNGVITIVSAISPYRAARNEARQRIGRFLEIFVNAPLTVCEQRDVKGLYRKARAGQIVAMTGIDDPYEAPLAADVECHTDRESPAESLRKIVTAIQPWLA